MAGNDIINVSGRPNPGNNIRPLSGPYYNSRSFCRWQYKPAPCKGSLHGCTRGDQYGYA